MPDVIADRVLVKSHFQCIELPETIVVRIYSDSNRDVIIDQCITREPTMTICFVCGCNHQGLRRTCKMFRFPSSAGLSTKWEKLCRRKDRAVVLQSDRICSCHFVDGDKNNGPTIFPWSCGKLFDFPDPTKINRTERKENQKMAVSSTSTSALSAMHCASSMDSTSAHINLDHSYQTSYHHLKEENQENEP